MFIKSRIVSAAFAAAVFLSIIFFLLMSRPAFANDVYIAQAASGSANGSSCANAYAYTYFNASGNWTTGTPGGTQIGPGTTVHLCGTITSELTFQGSGSSGNVITLLAETGAVLSSPGSTLINVNGQSYLLIDGGTTCGWISHAQTACNGTIQNTLNGTSGAACLGGSCSLQNNLTQIDMYAVSGASNVEIRNWLFEDAYLHTSTSDTTPNNTSENAVLLSSVGGTISIHNNIMHDCSWCIRVDSYSSGTVFQAYDNDIYNNDHDFAIGGTTSTTPITVYIHDSHSGAKVNWDAGSYFHHDGIHLTPYFQAASSSGVYIYNNQWDGNWGTATTAYIFMESQLPNVYIFNNVALWQSNSNLTNGQFGQIELTGGLIANNSFYADASFGSTGTGLYIAQSTSSTRVVNNLFSGLNVFQSNSSGALASTSDYNLYAHYSSAGGGSGWVWNGSQVSSLASWSSACGCDTHGISDLSSTLNVNSNAVPQSGFQGAAAATNLTSLGITALNSDASGTARPSSGAWDIGAYQYAGSSGGGTKISPPANLTGNVVVN